MGDFSILHWRQTATFTHSGGDFVYFHLATLGCILDMSRPRIRERLCLGNAKSRQIRSRTRTTLSRTPLSHTIRVGFGPANAVDTLQYRQ